MVSYFMMAWRWGYCSAGDGSMALAFGSWMRKKMFQEKKEIDSL